MGAPQGVSVVGVEFRNVGGALGNHPFPAGLNDCVSGLEWVRANQKAVSGNGVIVVEGESGGGNLSIATVLKGLKDGKLLAAGVYSMCPYIAGPEYYDLSRPRAKELPSLFENDGIMGSTGSVLPMAQAYTKDSTNPLAWPIFATVEDLKGCV